MNVLWAFRPLESSEVANHTEGFAGDLEALNEIQPRESRKHFRNVDGRRRQRDSLQF